MLGGALLVYDLSLTAEPTFAYVCTKFDMYSTRVVAPRQILKKNLHQSSSNFTYIFY